MVPLRAPAPHRRAVGGAVGGLIGWFIEQGRDGHGRLGRELPPGTAGIIALFDDADRLAVEQALPGALAKSIAQTDKKGVRALKDGLAEAMGKFVQDRTKLPIPDRTFGGTAGRTLDESVADWMMIAGPKPPTGRPTSSSS